MAHFRSIRAVSLVSPGAEASFFSEYLKEQPYFIRPSSKGSMCTEKMTISWACGYLQTVSW